MFVILTILFSSLAKAMENVTVEYANAMQATLATTVTAPQKQHPAFQKTGRCAAGEAAAHAAVVNVLSQGRLETLVKNALPALMPVVLKGKVNSSFYSLSWDVYRLL